MKHALTCIALLALTSLSASAAGLTIHWNGCAGNPVSVQNLNFACDSDSESFHALAQFRIPSALTGVTGVECTLDIAFAGTTVPPWWQFNAGECRSGVNSFIGPALQLHGAVPGCPDWANGQALGGLAAYNEGAFGPNTAHILGGFAAPTPVNLTSTTQDYLAFELVILSDNTTPKGLAGVACPGCAVPACIVFTRVKVISGQFVADLNSPQSPGSNFITWQGGAGVSSILGNGCPAATATLKSTWGRLKSLYR
ncbi:MAG TPA: hypothetical protein VI504_15445 [Candidatus Eisenbacteria bacterium]|jgi:hypothetical protein